MKYPLKGGVTIGSIMEILKRNTILKGYVTNGMNTNEYEELLDNTKYIQLKFYSSACFLGHI